ncbi:hypothetical protein ACLQ22_30310 [Micromonospora sp. DT178]
MQVVEQPAVRADQVQRQLGPLGGEPPQQLQAGGGGITGGDRGHR